LHAYIGTYGNNTCTSQFCYPEGIAFDNGNNVYVVDKGHHGVDPAPYPSLLDFALGKYTKDNNEIWLYDH